MDNPFDPLEQSDAELERLARLSDLGKVIAEKRDEAVEGRASSGIEKIWMACEEAYLGIDDENRQEWSNAQWSKPTSMNGPVTVDNGKRDTTRSTVYIPLTSRYVDAGHAKVCEMVIPIDDKPFSIEHTPVPELIRAKELLKSIMANGGDMPPQQLMPGAAPNPAAPQGAGPSPAMPAAGVVGVPQAVPQQPDPIAEAKKAIDQAADSAEKAERRMYDWLVESGFSAEMRKVVFDSARIGTGVLKGPVATISESKAVTRKGESVALQIEQKIVPGTSWVDTWNLFPDPACGENIHAGDYCFERDFLSARKLKELKRIPGYLEHAIDTVLKEGPGKCYLDESGQKNPNQTRDPKLARRRFEVWYYYGVVSKADVTAAKTMAADSLAEDVEDVFVMVTLVNDTVIRVVLNPLDSGHFPYRVFPWRRRAGSWAGVGVAEQAGVAQKMCNGATRSMMNNAGNSAGVQMFIDQELIYPMDQRWSLTPNKLWGKNPSAQMDDIRKAMQFVEIPDRVQTLMTIIEFAFRVAEESTNIPLISQGQSGATTPDTLGATELQNSNANQLLRNIACTIDDCIHEPLIQDLYEWLLLDPDVPNEEKGDYKINAHGSSALVERGIQNQTLQQLVAPSINPAYGVNPKLAMAEYLKSKRIDPRRVGYTDDEMARERQQQAPLAPAVQAAQIRADTDLKKTQMMVAEDAKQLDVENKTALVRIKHEIDRDTAFINAQSEQTQIEHESRMSELQMRLQLAQLDYASKHEMTLENVKSKLADTAMRLRTQKELALAGHVTDLHKHSNPQVATPAVEPAGRAAPGKAFEQ